MAHQGEAVNPLDPNEPASISRHRSRLVRRVREAYQRIDKWEQIHLKRLEDLRVFNSRFPRKTATGRTPTLPELQNVPAKSSLEMGKLWQDQIKNYKY